ncbi:hypothetical protein DPV93_05120 [Haemophilus sputorum]|uniref:Uncharacterized protein n=1 Tax=Haemophilus sputorum TaxID=1078480 RepID=A0A369YFK4_9PAST|nr:hypothetical protein [Haemophilus sputorum]RDE72663.1 hypothetical protein DPV93_05120 [Haemophilus sputorum]
MSNENIELYRGDDEDVIVRLFEKQQDKTLKPLDLSNIARFDLWANSDGKTVLTLSSTTGGIQVLDAVGGVIKLVIDHNLTKETTWTKADYDLKTISDTGRIKTLIKAGKIYMQLDITPTMDATQ